MLHLVEIFDSLSSENKLSLGFQTTAILHSSYIPGYIIPVSCTTSSFSAHFLNTGTAQCSVMSLLCFSFFKHPHPQHQFPIALSQVLNSVLQFCLHLWKPASECLPYIHVPHQYLLRTCYELCTILHC